MFERIGSPMTEKSGMSGNEDNEEKTNEIKEIASALTKKLE
jgi:hypothetical protein